MPDIISVEKQQAALDAILEDGAIYDDIKFWVEGARKSIEIEKKVLAAFVATFGERDRVTPQSIAENIVDGLYRDGLSIRVYAGAFGQCPVDDRYTVKLIAKIIEQSGGAP